MRARRAIALGAVIAIAVLPTSVPSARAAISPSFARAGDATAKVSATGAVLADRQISQRWSIGSQGQVTVSRVSDPVTGDNWASPGAPEFSLLLDSAPTTSTTDWRLMGATARSIAPAPGGAATGRGVEIAFRYRLASTHGPLELERVWSLYPGAGVEAVSERLLNSSPVAFRVGQYSLAQLTSSHHAIAEVLTYHGGSDWRQDFRSSAAEAGPFDSEGEVAQFDAGQGSGWFLVGQRRSGAMSRVGRDSAGRTWVGVDNARDAFDWGPVMSSPPDYNRLVNPAYPAPVRQRTLTPLGTLDLGQAYLGVYHGGRSQAAAVFAQDFVSHVMPTGRQTVDLNTFHPWGHGSGLSDANLRPQAQLFKQLGGEVFILDDQWQGKSSGDWRWDTSRFPLGANGVPAFVHYLHGLGVQLGLWMSPAEFNPGSAAYKAHPEWACTPTGDATAQLPDDSGLGVWDMTNPAVQSYMTGVISRLIAQDGVREFKFDYVTWVDCPPHDYLDYEDAYAHWVKLQQRLHPNVTFELDETNDQRLWPFRSVALGPSWFDNGHLKGSSYPARLLHDIWSAAPWIPPSSLGFGLYDGDLGGSYSVDYLMPIALLGHVTFWTDLTQLSVSQRAETAWWIGWYKAHRDDLGGLVYEDSSADPIGGKAWAVFQPWSGGHGYVFAFRQGGGPAIQKVALRGVDPGRSYTVTNVRTGTALGKYTGRQLERGLPVTLAAPYSAAVLSVTPG